MQKLIITTIFFSFLFLLFSEIDLMIVDLTYDSDIGFIWIDQYFFKLIYKSLYIIFPATAIMLITILIYSLYIKNRMLSKKSIYLIACFLIGPGIIVNSVFKENFGRARPTQMKRGKEYTKIFYISDQCSSNCSFTSGHAAFGYSFSAFSFIANRNRNLLSILSFSFGSILGIARILQGGHFLSDIIFSYLIVNIVNHILYKLFYTKTYK